MAQLVEQLIRNQQVVGSSPTISSRKKHLQMQVLFFIVSEANDFIERCHIR